MAVTSIREITDFGCTEIFRILTQSFQNLNPLLPIRS